MKICYLIRSKKNLNFSVGDYEVLFMESENVFNENREMRWIGNIMIMNEW